MSVMFLQTAVNKSFNYTILKWGAKLDIISDMTKEIKENVLFSIKFILFFPYRGYKNDFLVAHHLEFCSSISGSPLFRIVGCHRLGQPITFIRKPTLVNAFIDQVFINRFGSIL